MAIFIVLWALWLTRGGAAGGASGHVATSGGVFYCIIIPLPRCVLVAAALASRGLSVNCCCHRLPRPQIRFQMAKPGMMQKVGGGPSVTAMALWRLAVGGGVAVHARRV